MKHGKVEKESRFSVMTSESTIKTAMSDDQKLSFPAIDTLIKHSRISKRLFDNIFGGSGETAGWMN